MNDPEAADRFTALYDEFYPRVYGYVVSRAGRDIADEVVSETFVVAWRRLADIPEGTLPWLLGVARHVLKSQFRAEARRVSLAIEMRTWVRASTADDVADGVTERSEVLRALATLSDADRELLTLIAWHGLRPHEAARVVGCTKATLFVRLHRARRRLERAMAPGEITAVTRPTSPFAPEGTRLP